MGPGKLKDNRRTHHVDIPTLPLPTPIALLPDGRGPRTFAVPAARGDLLGEAVLVELKDRAKRVARHRKEKA